MEEKIEYDLGALRDALSRIDKNIKIFEEAIERELATKKEYRRMIGILEDKHNVVRFRSHR